MNKYFEVRNVQTENTYSPVVMCKALPCTNCLLETSEQLHLITLKRKYLVQWVHTGSSWQKVLVGPRLLCTG